MLTHTSFYLEIRELHVEVRKFPMRRCISMLEELAERADRAMDVFRQWLAGRRAEYLKKRREYEERRAAAIAKMGLLPYIKSLRRR